MTSLAAQASRLAPNYDRYSVTKGQGFTLLEVMVVLVIIGILTTMAGTFLLPSLETRQMRGQLQSLADQIEFAQHKAILNGRPYGVFLTAKGYEFVVYRDQQWSLIEEQGLPAIELDNRLQNLNKVDRLDEEPRPDIIISPTGEPPEVNVVIYKLDEGFRLHYYDNGKPTLVAWKNDT